MESEAEKMNRAKKHRMKEWTKFMEDVSMKDYGTDDIFSEDKIWKSEPGSLDYSMYNQILIECRKISESKNKDYGCQTMTRFMEKGLVVRMHDKMSRLINLVWDQKEASVSDEKIEDTAKDLVNYAVYLVMMKRKHLVAPMVRR